MLVPSLAAAQVLVVGLRWGSIWSGGLLFGDTFRDTKLIFVNE